MELNEKELLEKTYEMSKENNHILRGIRNSNRWASFFRFFYWIIIIGISLGTFYYIQPYTNKALSLYKSLQGNLNNVNTLVNSLPKAK